MFTLNIKRVPVAITAGGLALASSGAFAAAGADAVAAITAASADALLVCGALLTMGVAIWGAQYLRKKFFG